MGKRVIADWRVAARYTSVGEAAAARSALDVAGIDTYLADENADALQVMVHDADIERAQAILWNVSAPQSGQVACRECGSTNLRSIPRIRLLIVLSAIFVAVGFAVGQPVFGAIGFFAVAAGVALMPSHRCLDCGWASTPLDADVRRIPPLPIRGDMVELTCSRCGAINARALRRCESCGMTLR